jgi:hypothetical protein
MEQCTRTDPPHFEHDHVLIGGLSYFIDTVDVDGDDDVCRVRFSEQAAARIVPIEWLGKDDVTPAQIVGFTDGYILRVAAQAG